MHWSIPWSDLMMTMFIVFVIMYVYRAANPEVLSQQAKRPKIGAEISSGADIGLGNGDNFQEASRQSISKIYDLSRETVRSNDLEAFAKVDLVPDKAVRIVLASDLLFDSGKADLRPEARRSLRRIGTIIEQTPFMVNVVGHTDNVPIHSERFPTNWELSAARACEVARFLIRETGVPGNRFYVSGHAYYQPVFPNSSPSNRATNRRVEIIITKEMPGASPGIGAAAPGPGLEDENRQAVQGRDTWPWNTF